MFKPLSTSSLALLSIVPALALAQAGPASGGAAAPAAPMATATSPAPAVYRSAFEGYQPYTEEKTISWKEANDLTGRIGGWRAYAKEAQQSSGESAPAVAKPADPHAGHAKPAQVKP